MTRAMLHFCGQSRAVLARVLLLRLLPVIELFSLKPAFTFSTVLIASHVVEYRQDECRRSPEQTVHGPSGHEPETQAQGPDNSTR